MSKRQDREKAVAKKRAKGKLRKSHRFGEKLAYRQQTPPTSFMTGEGG